MSAIMHATTILAVRRPDAVVIGGDGQVSMGHTILKGNARKIRRLYHQQVLAGFAGATADAFTLFEHFESHLEQFQGQLLRAAVEMTKQWRTDRTLRRLEALLCVADASHTLLLTGNGDVVEPEHDVIAIGSGGHFAESAARALHQHTTLNALQIVKHSMQIAASTCVYTNSHLVTEELKLCKN